MTADDPVRKLALAALDADAQARDLLLPEAGAQKRIAFSVLYRYATDPAYQLSPAENALLAGDAAAQADLARLIADGAIAYMPQQAAAASEGPVRRETDAAVVTLTPSRADVGQNYLGIELRDPERKPPVQMFVTRTNAIWHCIELPEFVNGRAQLLVEADSDIVRALCDMESEVYLR